MLQNTPDGGTLSLNGKLNAGRKENNVVQSQIINNTGLISSNTKQSKADDVAVAE